MWEPLFNTLPVTPVVRQTLLLTIAMGGLIAFLVGLWVVLKGPASLWKSLRNLSLCLLIYAETFRQKFLHGLNQLK